eukprot:XP_023156140.1 uncharacterized protein LOC111589534 [Zea mays]
MHLHFNLGNEEARGERMTVRGFFSQNRLGKLRRLREGSSAYLRRPLDERRTTRFRFVHGVALVHWILSLSELGRHLLDVACFLHLLLNPAHNDSPPPTPTGRRRARRSPHPAAPRSPSLLAGILSDLAEIGGSLRVGFSCAAAPDRHASAVLESQPAAASPPASPPPLVAAAAKEIADDVVGAARALAVHLEAWIDFTVLALDDRARRRQHPICQGGSNL